MIHSTLIGKDPYNLGSYFKLENHPQECLGIEYVSLIARPVLMAPQMGDSFEEPLVSYIKITHDPRVHRLKIAIYCQIDNVGKIKIGHQKSTKKPDLAKRVISTDSEVRRCAGTFIAYFKDGSDSLELHQVFHEFECLKNMEVPVIDPTLRGIISTWRRVSKWLASS